MSFRKKRSNKFQNIIKKQDKQNQQMGEDCTVTKISVDWKSRVKGLKLEPSAHHKEAAQC